MAGHILWCDAILIYIPWHSGAVASTLRAVRQHDGPRQRVLLRVHRLRCSDTTATSRHRVHRHIREIYCNSFCALFTNFSNFFPNSFALPMFLNDVFLIVFSQVYIKILWSELHPRFLQNSETNFPFKLHVNCLCAQIQFNLQEFPLSGTSRIWLPRYIYCCAVWPYILSWPVVTSSGVNELFVAV